MEPGEAVADGGESVRVFRLGDGLVQAAEKLEKAGDIWGEPFEELDYILSAAFSLEESEFGGDGVVSDEENGEKRFNACESAFEGGAVVVADHSVVECEKSLEFVGNF